jgi:uncharacterized membrane protein YfcA
MDFTLASYALGFAAALLVGLSKTGVPGVSLPAILLMSEAFAGNEKASVAAILPLLLLGDCFSVGFYHQHADWKRLGALFPYVALGMAPGVVVLVWASHGQFKLVLGWLVLGLLAMEAGRRKLDWDHLPHRGWFAALMGVLAGFGTMVGNAAGPIMSIYLISRGMLKQQFMGTWAWFFLIVNSSKIPVFLAMKRLGGPDLLSFDALQFDLVVIPLVVVGAIVGRRVLQLVPQKVFNPVVLALAGVAAVRLVWG